MKGKEAKRCFSGISELVRTARVYPHRQADSRGSGRIDQVPEEDDGVVRFSRILKRMPKTIKNRLILIDFAWS